jgi:DNA invertase Pin-like site-specific DNA recombinase
LGASTDRQVEAPNVQEDIIARYCERAGLPVATMYVDTAVSGKLPLADRPAGARLIADLRPGDHVVVARIDRLSRNFLDFVHTVDTWSRLGITLHPCDFHMVIRPDDPTCLAFIQMMGVFAAFERRLIRNRTREALQWRKSIGRKVSKDAPLGFRWARRSDGHSWRQECPHEAPLCLKAVELATEGYTYQQMADYYNNEWRVQGRRPGFLRWKQKHFPRLIAGGLLILELRGQPLPEGAATCEELRLR